jgi:hypothetical protein
MTSDTNEPAASGSVFGLTELDEAAIAELTARAASSKASGVVSWWSTARSILWLGLFQGGQAGTWMMVPADSKASAAQQRERFCELIGIQLEINRLVTGSTHTQ